MTNDCDQMSTVWDENLYVERSESNRNTRRKVWTPASDELARSTSDHKRFVNDPRDSPPTSLDAFDQRNV